jgi:hypothetical protein
MTTTLSFIVEAAFGADLTAASSSWVWTDVTSWVKGSIAVKRGRPPGSTQSSPAECSLRLDDTDSRFTPRHPLGAYYPGVNLGTPIRVKLNPGTGAAMRFQGYMASIAPYWPGGNSDYAEVVISAKGILWRLNQGRTLRSPLVRAITAQSPIAAWALEDGSGASSAANLVVGGRPLVLDGATLGNSSDLAGTTVSASLPAGARLIGIAPTTSVTGFVAVDIWFKAYTTSATATKVKLASVNLTGDIYKLDLEIDNPAAFANGYTFTTYHGGSADTSGASTTALNPFDGAWHNVFFYLHQIGANVATRLYVDGVFVSPLVSLASVTLGVPTSVVVQNKLLTGDSGTVIVASAAIYNDASASNTYSAGLGYVGETATDRLTRLCGEENIDLTLVGSSTITMGAQPTGTLLDLLRECEAADGGILSDGLSAGVKYLSRSSRENQAVTLALDAAIGQVKLPFEPIEDDQRLITREVVSRRNGSSVPYEDTAKEATAGVYESSTTLNVSDDSMLADQASWRVHLATVEEMRAPTITLNLLDRPELIASWLASDVGLRYTAANPPDQYPPGGLDLTFEQLSEVFDATTWTADTSGSPFAPWRVGTVETGANRLRLDTDGSVLLSSLTSGATSTTVKTSGDWPVWLTTAGRPDDFPLDIEIEGEQVIVTAISSVASDTFGRTVSNSWGTATSGQSWSQSGGSASDYSVGSGAGTQSHAAVNTLHYNTMEIGSTDFDLVSDTSWAIATPTGAAVGHWVLGRLTDTSNYYAARLFVTTSGTVTLDVSKRVTGTLSIVGSAITICPVHAAGDVWRVRFQAHGTALRAKAWPAGTGEPTGWLFDLSDSSLTSGTQIGAASRLENGNTNTLPVVASWDNLDVTNPQVFTIARSVNGIVKAHSAGAAVALWRPAVLAL